MDGYFSDTALIKTPPIKRAAYSDRTAWLLAEISRLVYEPLPCEESSAALIPAIRDAIDKGEEDTVLEALISRARRQGIHPDNGVVEVLKKGRFDLVESFAENGTEAMLAKLQPDDDFPGMVILAFRGTQPNIKDVLTDVKADLVNAEACNGRVHRGFQDAFKPLQKRISDALAHHQGIPLYITGHSLGGALALLATRLLCNDSIGACYTYGCPRVADDNFFKGIKTPVYRVVNAADGVAKVPFGYGFSSALGLLRLIPINGTLQIAEWLRKYFLGYTHYGTLVFLSDAANIKDNKGIDFKDLQVINSPNIFWRISIVLPRLIATRFKAAASDHAIRDYSAKLLAHAQRRNQ
ncbi:lipase family protein [Desulfuromonas acetoxidans]|uniref:lipase family protein n=1 Tax=Desulfuromonas acetoxidans TaxID=891 RepID=UPI002930189B|nr:lipase family protein [Desulfuromonas acetoxidans]